jgi:hypothetical protein
MIGGLANLRASPFNNTNRKDTTFNQMHLNGQLTLKENLARYLCFKDL